MTRLRSLALLIALCTFIAARTAVASVTDETAHSAAAIIAVDDHWSQAEIHGDVSYLDQLLLPDYRSVDAHGRVNPKSTILKRARENGSSPVKQQKILRYMHTHPLGETVALHGDTAVLIFYSPRLGPQRGILLANVFVFANGGWRALYSQHTDAQRT